MMNYWDLEREVHTFSKAANYKKKEIINGMLDSGIIGYYSYPSMLESLLPQLNDNESLRLVKNYIKTANFSYTSDCYFDVIKDVYKLDKKDIKHLIRTSGQSQLKKVLLILDDLTPEDEILGLRSISKSKNISNKLFKIKYAPSLDAIKSLPPVMRLNAIEALLNNNNLSYNVFENIKDTDEFKSLLFGSVLRHRDRVEVVCKKYSEVKNLGIEHTIVVNCSCDNCGDYKISVTSGRACTEVGFKNIDIGRFLHSGSCSLCGAWSQNEKEKKFIYPEVK